MHHFLCDLRKPHNTQYGLFKLRKSKRKELDRGAFARTSRMDLYKAYAKLLHKLPIVPFSEK